MLKERGEGAHAVEGVQLLVPQLEHAVLVDDLVRVRVRARARVRVRGRGRGRVMVRATVRVRVSR